MEVKKLPKEFFPKSLFEIPQPPKNLWILGDLPDPNLVYLSVVGSRSFSSYGKEVCEKLIEGLKGYPVCIVSGFAMGIDTIAHKSAIKAGLKTLVFPGSGLDPKVIYPRTNFRLVDEILTNGGCFLSEFEPEFKATIWTFPMRNRLMAGISKAVLIIEAEEKSGTLITARLALDYNRDVLTVPQNIFAKNGVGINKLIKQGATVITSANDLLEALGFEIKDKNDTKKQKVILEDLTPEEKKIYKILLVENTEREDLIFKLGLPAYQVNALISIMEIKGLIKEEMGEIKII